MATTGCHVVHGQVLFARRSTYVWVNVACENGPQACLVFDPGTETGHEKEGNTHHAQQRGDRFLRRILATDRDRLRWTVLRSTLIPVPTESELSFVQSSRFKRNVRRRQAAALDRRAGGVWEQRGTKFGQRYAMILLTMVWCNVPSWAVHLSRALYLAAPCPLLSSSSTWFT